MQRETVPFYDPKISYSENYDLGPFGQFRTVPESRVSSGGYELFGIPLDLPFGIPAGPLLNGKFIEAAWAWGFSIATYKTVREKAYPAHPFPNVIRVKAGGDIHPGDTVIAEFDMNGIDISRDGITNSFGVPSKDTQTWQEDVQNTLASLTPGNVMILSFMGTKHDAMTRDAYIQSFVETCRLAIETEAPILEVNSSCPNVGAEGLICTDVMMSRDILEALHEAKGSVPLLVKIGYMRPEQRGELKALLDAIHHYADGVVAINTISATVHTEEHDQALPGGKVRMSSGVCGAAIRWAGLEMAEYIVETKKANGWNDFVVIGVGGVTTPEDYVRYMTLGVDAVQSATGAMWRPTLAREIQQAIHT